MAEWLNYTADKAEHTVVGDLRVLKNVHSPQLNNQRDLLVWLPPSYERSERRYPVLYMHDGQNLFDHTTSFCGEWMIDDVMLELADHGLEAIIVGLPNSGPSRCNEYSPFDEPRFGPGCGDDYLRFIIDTVKPLIDHDFRTLPDREHTGIMGSSMGGLISLYAFVAYNHVFGYAGALSPALWYARKAIFSYIRQGDLPQGRLYLDIGLDEGQRMVANTRHMRDLLHGMGLEPSMLYVEEPNAPHSECAWGERLHLPLIYFMCPTCNETQIEAMRATALAV